MSLATVAKDFERLSKKARTLQTLRCQCIDDVLRELEEAKAALDSLDAEGEGTGESGGGEAQLMDVDDGQSLGVPMEICARSSGGILGDLQQGVARAAAAGNMASEEKELSTMLSKLSKAVDKVMPPDIGKAVHSIEFPPELLNQVILEHLLRCGRVEIARLFAEEAQLPLDESHVGPYVEILQVMAEIKEKKLESAIEFVRTHHDSLLQRGASLPLRVAKMRYLQLLEEGKAAEAIMHAKIHFPRYFGEHAAEKKEILQLMGCVAYMKRGLLTSPYKHFFAPSSWPDLADLFWREGCETVGLESQKPLAICVTAGIKALPTLLKFATVMQGRLAEWGKSGTLPVEVDLGPECQYHSVFICPVSREQASLENPPMMMQCGHVLCEQALRKLSRSGGRFKCPYCPVQVSLQGSLRLTF